MLHLLFRPLQHLELKIQVLRELPIRYVVVFIDMFRIDNQNHQIVVTVFAFDQLIEHHLTTNKSKPIPVEEILVK